MEHTSPTHNTGRHRRKILRLLPYGALILLWLGSGILSAATSEGLVTSNIKLSPLQLNLVDLAFAVPGLFIWCTILFAALSIRRYSRLIAGSKDSAGFRYIAYGVLVLLANLVAGSYLAAFQQLVSRHAADPQHVKTVFVVINNYALVLSALATYGLLLAGGRSLLRSIGRRLDLIKLPLTAVAAFAVLLIGYLWLIYHNPARQVSVDHDIDPTFGLPYWLIVFTVALPLAVSWFMGIVAMVSMREYRRRISGIIYKKFFAKLVTGMTLLIGVNIFLQILTQLYSLYANSSLSALLTLIAVLYIILVYAFILMAQGARKLNKIETLLVE